MHFSPYPAAPPSRHPTRASAGVATPDVASPEVDVEVEETTDEGLQEPWRVILYNDDIHTFDEVIFQLMKATGCSLSRARELTFEVDAQGKAAVYEGDFEDCLRVQSVLREIELVTEIQG